MVGLLTEHHPWRRLFIGPPCIRALPFAIAARNRTRKSGGVLAALNGWHRDPFTHRPDVGGESRRHGRCPFSDPPVFVTFIKRSNRPAEIRAVHLKVGHHLVHPPSLRELVRLAGLPRVVVPVRRVLPLQERGVDPPADFRPRQRRHHRGGGGQPVRLAQGDHRRAPARPIDPPGSNGAVGAVPGDDSRGLLGPAPGHRNSIPARTIPYPGHGETLPKGDRQGVRPVLRAPSYDRYAPPSSAAVPPPPTASRPPPTPSPCAPTSGPSPDASNR